MVHLQESPETSARAAKTFTNELPAPYQSWLRFYDDIPDDVRNEPVIKHQQFLSLEMYEGLFGEYPRNGTLVEWTINRDYYLARVAEELLPAGVSRDDYHAAKMASHSRDFNTQPVDLVLDKAGQVAYRGRD